MIPGRDETLVVQIPARVSGQGGRLSVARSHAVI